MYPYPQPYPAPAYVQPLPRPRTQPGLRWSLVGIALILGYFTTTALVGVALGGVFTSFQPGSIDSYLAAVGAVLLAAILLVVVGIVVLVFYFIGFGYLYAGRNEFGPTHARNVQISLVLIILAIVMGVVNVAAVAIINGSALRFTGQGWEIEAGMYYTGAIVGTVLGIVVAALVAAHFVLNVRALAPPKQEIILYAAAALGTATPGIVGSLTLLQLPQYIAFIGSVVAQPFGTFLPPPPVDPGVGLPMIVGGALGIVTFLLYFWAYRAASARIRTGELKPILLPPAAVPMMPWVPMAPMYPVPPAAPPQPPAQPPASP